MGMGRAVGGAFQNGVNNFRSQNPPQGGYNGKGGAAQQPQMGGMGGKGKGGAAQQPQVQQPQGGFGGKGGQQPYPYAQQYYQPQFQPDTFNNPYAQGGFGGKGGQIQQFLQNQPQPQGGFNGKGGQMSGMSDLQRMRPQGQQSYQDYVNRPTQELKMSEEQFNAQQAAPAVQGYARDPRMGGMGGKGGQMGGYPQMPRRPHGFRGAAQQGLAGLAQPTATTQAATPAPEQPYMGNYMS